MDCSLKNENEKNNCKLVLENVPWTIDKDILSLKFESIYFCGENNEIINIIEKDLRSNDQKSRLVIIEYKNSDDVERLLKMPYIEIQSTHLKCRAYTKDDDSLFVNQLNKYTISDNNPDNRHITINTKDDSVKKIESTVIKKLSLDFPFYLLSKHKKILEKLKINLLNDFNADLLIKYDCYEIKRRQRKFNETESFFRESNQVWLMKLESFLDKFEKDEFESKNVLKNEKNKLFWLDLEEFLRNKCELLEINLTLKDEIASLEGTKEALSILNKSLTAFEENQLISINKENEVINFIEKNVNKDFIEIIKKEKYFEKCKNFDQNLKINYNTETNELLYNGTKKSIQIATQKLKSLKSCLIKENHSFDWYIVDFLMKCKEYIEEIISFKNINCAFEITELNDFNREPCSIQIISIKEKFIHDCLNMIRDTFKVVKYDVSQNSLELLKNNKFNQFLSKKVDELKLSNEHIRYIIRIEKQSKQIICTGEKLLVDRLLNDINDFFDSNTIYSKYYNEFSYEDIEFFRKVIQKKLVQFSEKFKIKIEFESIKQILEDLVKFDIYKLRITTNVSNHDRCLNFLNDLLKTKKVVTYKLKHEEVMEYFCESKGLNDISNLENLFECSILLPIHLKHVENTNDFGSKSSEIANDSFIQSSTKNVSFEFISNSIQLEIKCIDTPLIEYDGADVIVIFLNNQLDANNQLSQQIIDIVGLDVLQELQLILIENNFLIYNGQCYSTNSGELRNFKNIIFGILPLLKQDEDSFDELLNQCLINSFLECDFRKNYNKIAFSILDSIESNENNEHIANLVLNTIINHFSNTNETFIQSIHLVEPIHYDIFKECLVEKSKMPHSSIRIKSTNKTNLNIHKSKKQNNIIEVIYGSICDENIVSDVIVNSTNSELDLKAGILSNTLLKLGGKAIQDELNTKYPNRLRSNDILLPCIAVSGAGSLKNKKFIFHTVFPNWSENKKSIEKIKNILRTLLDELEKIQLSTICFPAIGTGNLKYPVEVIPDLMFETFNEYLDITKTSSIKKIFIVVYDKDLEVIKAFKNYLNQEVVEEKNMTKNISLVNHDKELTVSCSNYKSIKNCCSLDFDKVKVNAYIGDITKASVDVIFNPTSSTFDLGGNVSKALIEKGGSGLLQEIDSNKKMFINGICFTGVGDLKCKSLIHVDVRVFDIITSVKKALEHTNEKKFESLVLPVIGTGKIKSNPESSIKDIIYGIVEFIQSVHQNGNSLHLKSIEICVHDKQSSYINYFEKVFSELFEKKKLKSSLIDLSNKLNGNLNKNFNQKNNQMFKLISDSIEKINSVKDELEKLADSEMIVEEIINEYFEKIDFDSKLSIENLCKKEFVNVKWEKNKLKLSGRQKHISKSINSIMKVITNHALKKQASIVAEMTALKVQWEYFKKDKWIPHNMYINSEIEEMYLNKIKTREIVGPKNVVYIFDIENMLQVDKLNPKKSFKLKRVNFDELKIAIELPKVWLPNQHQNIIELNATDNEYQTVLKKLNDTSLNLQFIKKAISIHRIQNKRLFIQYQTQKELFEKNNASNEMTLFHGTSEDCVSKIWSNGFNRNYAGKNATAFGKGVYFAKNSSYSHSYTDKRLGKKIGHMFIAKVLIGNVAIGSSNMNFPPHNADTTVNHLTNPEIFVIYHDAQAYPEYLLTYE